MDILSKVADEMQDVLTVSAENNEKPVHTVYLNAFYIDKYEVTNAQYKKFMDTTDTVGELHFVCSSAIHCTL